MSSLLVFRRLTHDSHGGLAGVFGCLAGPVRLEDMLRECLVDMRVLWKRLLANRAALYAVNFEKVRRLPLSCANFTPLL